MCNFGEPRTGFPDDYAYGVTDFTDPTMSTTETKPRLQETSTFEIDDSHHLDPQRTTSANSNHSTLINSSSPSRLLDAIRLGLLVLALCLSVLIVGTSADNLRTYNETHVADEFHLPLWPFEFNLGPSIALVACGSVMLVVSVLAIAGAKVSSLRNNPAVYRLIIFSTSIAGLLSAIIATSFFYSINTSSIVASIQSWSCHWRDLDLEGQKPDFARVCSLAKTGLYSDVACIALWVLIGVLGIMGVVRERSATKAREMVEEEKM